jgi:hypothetical protein
MPTFTSHLASGLSAGMAFAVAGITFGQSPDVDWKVLGVMEDNGSVVCFYDAKGVTREAEDRIRVWTKCLFKKDLDAVDIQKEFGGMILERAAEKLAKNYVPPAATIATIDADGRVGITAYEETANISQIEPRTKGFCPPEGNGWRLLKLLCPKR